MCVCVRARARLCVRACVCVCVCACVRVISLSNHLVAPFTPLSRASWRQEATRLPSTDRPDTWRRPQQTPRQPQHQRPQQRDPRQPRHQRPQQTPSCRQHRQRQARRRQKPICLQNPEPRPHMFMLMLAAYALRGRTADRLQQMPRPSRHRDHRPWHGLLGTPRSVRRPCSMCSRMQHSEGASSSYMQRVSTILMTHGSSSITC